MKISVISPVYKAEKIVDELVRRIDEEVSKLTDDYEIILVEDGSPDNSWEKVEENCYRNKKVKGIKLSRNFGQHYAVTAGISKASGDFIVLMDCDLQDDPCNISSLLYKFNNGNEIVFTKRIKRKHSLVKEISSKVYNFLFTFFSDKNYDINMGSLVGFGKMAQEAFLKFPDRERLYIQVLKWIGFKNTYIEVIHKQRFDGKSSYNFFGLIKLALEGWTSHSDKLLRLNIYVGFFLSFFSFLFGLVVIFRYFFDKLQPGWPSIIVTVLFSTGIILISIGIVGIYIGKTFEQSKNRPLFIIQQEIN